MPGRRSTGPMKAEGRVTTYAGKGEGSLEGDMGLIVAEDYKLGKIGERSPQTRRSIGKLTNVRSKNV